MLEILDGFSSVIWIVAASGAIIPFPIRYLQLTHVVLQNQQHNFRHNEKLVVHFNYILDGKVNYLRFVGQVKLDNRHGIGLMFEQDSLLRQVSRRLIKAPMYDNPCHHLSNQLVVPISRRA